MRQEVIARPSGRLASCQGVRHEGTRRETLRRRIALYRRYLSEGIDVDLACQYLDEIKAAEAELAEIEKDDQKRS